MRDLSLHMLDLMENSLRAGASRIYIGITEDLEQDILMITVEDDGPGLRVDSDAAMDPFYTTKDGSKTGLGLSLLGAAAERAGGGMELGKSQLGGLMVTATMGLRHVDRCPLGDLAATLSAVVCTNPGIDLRCIFRVADRESNVQVSKIYESLPENKRGGLAVARLVSEQVKNGLSGLHVTA